MNISSYMFTAIFASILQDFISNFDDWFHAIAYISFLFVGFVVIRVYKFLLKILCDKRMFIVVRVIGRITLFICFVGSVFGSMFAVAH